MKFKPNGRTRFCLASADHNNKKAMNTNLTARSWSLSFYANDSSPQPCDSLLHLLQQPRNPCSGTLMDSFGGFPFSLRRLPSLLPQSTDEIRTSIIIHSFYL